VFEFMQHLSAHESRVVDGLLDARLLVAAPG
jgi:hypothetical protein